MKWWFQGISNATISVDTFLLMAGLLVSFLLLAELDKKKGKFNFGWFYLHRYLRFALFNFLKNIPRPFPIILLFLNSFRLTPVYAIVLGFIATLIVYMGTGPNWYNIETSAYGCRINWWWHLLYSESNSSMHNSQRYCKVDGLNSQ
jgi:hypothetical protein